MSTLAAEKARTRARLRDVRRALDPQDVLSRGARLQANVLQMAPFRAAHTIALYAALAGEVPTDALLAAALAAGKHVVFPAVPTAGKHLVFREVDNRAQLVPTGPLRIFEPEPGRPRVALDAINLFIIPGLGFSRAGHRLGQGAGYYDATLAGAPKGTPRIGLAFSEHVLPSLPVEENDVAMHWVVTEESTFTAPGAPATVLGAASHPT